MTPIQHNVHNSSDFILTIPHCRIKHLFTIVHYTIVQSLSQVMQYDISITIHHQMLGIELKKGLCLGMLMESCLPAVMKDLPSMLCKAEVDSFSSLYSADNPYCCGKLHFKTILSMQIQGRGMWFLLWVGMYPSQAECSLLLVKVNNVLLPEC